jgi:hypothetical protein
MSGSDFVVLRSGLIVAAPAVRLALDLESRGLTLGLDGESLTVGPKHRISDEDRQAIRTWRWHLRAIVAESHRESIQ